MKYYYAVLPDGQERPSAVFEQLEDAIDWGLGRHGADAFRIRRMDVIEVERTEAVGASRLA